jgi:hypothetical protein
MRFAASMASRTNDELLDVVRGPADDCEPEAIEAAKAELAQRGVDVGSQPYRGVDPTNLPAPRKKVRLDPGMKLVGLILGVTLSVLGVLIALGMMSTWKRKGDPRDGAQFAVFAPISLLLLAATR